MADLRLPEALARPRRPARRWRLPVPIELESVLPALPVRQSSLHRRMMPGWTPCLTMKERFPHETLAAALRRHSAACGGLCAHSFARTATLAGADPAAQRQIAAGRNTEGRT